MNDGRIERGVDPRGDAPGAGRRPMRAAARRAYVAALAAWLSVVLTLLTSSAAVGQTCPSPSDIHYTVKDNDTLSEIAARTYCVKSVTEINAAWAALHVYNKIPVGENPHKIYTGTGICFPEHLQYARWSGSRCISPEEASALAAGRPVPARAQSSGPSVCGNNRKEGAEVCDLADMGGLTCEKLGLGKGSLTCLSDCGALDASGCELASKQPPCPPVKEIIKEVPAPPEKKKPLDVRVAVEILAGGNMPLVPATYDTIHRFIFVGGVGARVTIEGFEMSPRALFVVGQHGTNFNDIEQQQQIIGGGGALQLGVPFSTGDIRLTPGLEAGLLYIRRSIDRIDYPYEGDVTVQSGYIPFTGIFFRPEYLLGKAKRVSLALDLSFNLIMASLAGNQVLENFNAKLLGGVGYAF